MERFVFLFVCFVSIPVINGLQCPTCTYITSDAEIPAIVRSIVDGFLDLFQDNECAKNLKGPIPEIKEETCEMISGKVPRCSYYKGRITVKIPLPVVPDLEIPLQIYQRGCYHSKPANVPAVGCHRRQDINEDATVIKQFINEVTSAFEDYEIAKFEGEMCLYVDTYGLKTSGAAKGSLSSPLLLLMVCIVGYLCL